jgi:mannobiose 2-epimerase
MRAFDSTGIATSMTPLYKSRIEEKLFDYHNAAAEELHNILDYWMNYTSDEANGGFVGRIDHENKVDALAAKGSVLNSRILWSFSSAYVCTGRKDYLDMAERAFAYLLDHFIDEEYGGVYWTLDFAGKPLDTRKQIYAQAFAVYGLAEYHKASQNEEARISAIRIYQEIKARSYEKKNGGYIEALARDWTERKDVRLSARDANERKSMNTHLHILEAFANLYTVWPDQNLRQDIVDLIHLFLDHIFSKKTRHLDLFFDDDWNVKSNLVSYGHDIEAAWLIQEAANIIGDAILLQQVNNCSILLTNSAADGLDEDGGLWYEFDMEQKRLVSEKHWWPQAEAMVGFFNAWQISGDEKYMDHSLRSWQFIQKHICDNDYGEWKWGVKGDYSDMDNEDKVGIWKCPYHNSRACLEIVKRTRTEGPIS